MERGALFVLVTIALGCGPSREPATIELRPSAPRAATKLDVEDAGIAPSPPEPPVDTRGLGAFVQCDVVHGRILACAGPAEGAAVVEQPDGTFRGCDLAHGAVVSCGGHAGGIAAVFDGRGYLQCRLVHGHVAECLGPYDGPAVVERIAGSHAHE